MLRIDGDTFDRVGKNVGFLVIFMGMSSSRAQGRATVILFSSQTAECCPRRVKIVRTGNKTGEMVLTAKTGVSLPNHDGENSRSACKGACSNLYGQHQAIFIRRRIRELWVLPVYSDNALGFVS